MKAASEGVGMFELEPARAKKIAFYREHMAEYDRISDALSYPRFTSYCLDELTRIVRNNEAAGLIQAVVRIENYTDQSEHQSIQRAVKRLLRVEHGMRLPRGKRPRPGMVKLVSHVAPILLFYGLPCRTNETSRLVMALRFVAEEIKLDGDPRDELRRLKRQQTRRTNETRRIVFSAFAEALKPSKINPS